MECPRRAEAKGYRAVIQLTRLDGSPFMVNADLIETIEETPTTVVALTTHKRYTVQEPAAVIVDRIIAFRRQIARAPLSLVSPRKDGDEPTPPIHFQR
jgi:flagellar protein FlbD